MNQDVFLRSYAYYAVNLDHFEMNPHTHPAHELMYLVDGSCEVEVDGKRMTLKPNQFIFVRQGVPHCLSIHSRCTLLNYEFSFAKQDGVDVGYLLAQSADCRAFLAQLPPYFVRYDKRKLGYALKDLIDELEQSRDGVLLPLLVQRMLLELTYNEAQNSQSGILYLKKAKSFMEQNFQQPIQVADIADFVGVNHSYLQTLFSKEFGCGLMQYVAQLRLDRAGFLLANSSSSVIDIAFAVGFNSRQHFAYSFQKRFGMSPQKYRKIKGQAFAVDTHDFRVVENL